MGISQPPVPMAQLLLLLSCTLLACKLGKSEDDPDARALPTVDSSAPATQPATPLAPPPAAPTPAAPTPAASTPAAPTQPVTATTGAKSTGTTGAKPDPKPTTTGATATTGAAAGTTSTTGAAAGTTGGVAVPTALCINRCGNRLRKCIADAKLGDDVAAKCQGAFKACQKDCE